MTLDQYIDRMEDEIIRSLQGLIRIPSVGGAPEVGAPFGADVQRALEYTLKLSEELGFRTVNRENLAGYAEYGQGEEMIAVLGHIDVVPAGDGWTHPPYAGEVSDGRIWGRGTLDDKGAVVGALYGLKAIRDSGIPLKRRIRIIFGTNEERGSRCIAHYNEVDEQPVAGFTPDADYPIIFAEKGSVNTVHRRCFAQENKEHGEKSGMDSGRAAEPGALRILEAWGGTVVNAVPGEAKAQLAAADGRAGEARARLILAQEKHEKITVTEEPETGTFYVTAKGTSAHGSVPWLGENASITLLEFLKEVLDDGDIRNSCIFLLRALERQTDGRSLGIAMEDSVSGGLTVNAGLFSLTKQEARVSLDIRYPVTKKPEDFMEGLETAFAEGGFSTELTAAKEPLYVREDSPLIKSLQKVYKEKTGLEPELLAIGGGTYAKAMKNIVAFGPLFPGEEDTAHQADEFIGLDSLMTTVKIMAAAMVELACR